MEKYDGNPATMKAWFFDLEKQVGQRGGDLKSRKSLVYLRTSALMTDFIKERLLSREFWKVFSDALITRCGVLLAPVDVWHSLISIRQSCGLDRPSSLWMTRFRSHPMLHILWPRCWRLFLPIDRWFMSLQMPRSIKDKLIRDKPTTFQKAILITLEENTYPIMWTSVVVPEVRLFLTCQLIMKLLFLRKPSLQVRRTRTCVGPEVRLVWPT